MSLGLWMDGPGWRLGFPGVCRGALRGICRGSAPSSRRSSGPSRTPRAAPGRFPAAPAAFRQCPCGDVGRARAFLLASHTIIILVSSIHPKSCGPIRTSSHRREPIKAWLIMGSPHFEDQLLKKTAPNAARFLTDLYAKGN